MKDSLAVQKGGGQTGEGIEIIRRVAWMLGEARAGRGGMAGRWPASRVRSARCALRSLEGGPSDSKQNEKPLPPLVVVTLGFKEVMELLQGSFLRGLFSPFPPMIVADCGVVAGPSSAAV